MELDARKQKILAAIILDYISTAEPVGSRTISRKYDIGVSPATIRNEMADLEEMGLIEQPYTSAGRIPSDVGYRYYVDCLMEKATLALEAQTLIENTFKSKIKQIEDLVQLAIKVLSQMTHYTSLVVAPQLGKNTLQLIQLMLIEPGKALIVVVTDGGKIENRILDVPESVTKQDLDLVSQILNEKFKGLTVTQWEKALLKEIYAQLINQKKVLSLAIDLLDSILNEETEDKVYLGGTLNILNQPEFKDVNKVKNLFEILEREELLSKLLTNNTKEGVSVKIGSENEYEGIQECSIITATYKLNGEVLGTLGVLGPTRMQYPHAMSILEFLTQTLNKSLKKL